MTSVGLDSWQVTPRSPLMGHPRCSERWRNPPVFECSRQILLLVLRQSVSWFDSLIALQQKLSSQSFAFVMLSLASLHTMLWRFDFSLMNLHEREIRALDHLIKMLPFCLRRDIWMSDPTLNLEASYTLRESHKRPTQTQMVRLSVLLLLVSRIIFSLLGC